MHSQGTQGNGCIFPIVLIDRTIGFYGFLPTTTITLGIKGNISSVLKELFFGGLECFQL